MRQVAVGIAEPEWDPPSPKERRAWYLYDWGNSAFSTTVVTLFLGPYLTAIAKSAAAPDGLIHPFGIPIDPRSLWSYLISLSVITQVLIMPLIGSLADFGHKKKQLLGGLAYTGALATMAMFFVKGKDYQLGAILFLIANLAFGCSIVIYNSFLAVLAAPEDRDDVSSRGWGIGYLGGFVLLALNLVLFSNAKSLGITEGFAVRVSIASAGIWWAVFTIPAMIHLRNRGPVRELASNLNMLTTGWRQFRATLAGAQQYPQTLLFLGAYLLYNDAIQTVIALAGQFGADELHIPMSQLTLAILMVQFVAFFGAELFNRIAKRTGAKRAVIGSLVIWTGILVYIYVSVNSVTEFFVMAALVGTVMGGSQALSRSIYSLLIPRGEEAAYFSIYEITDKGTSWMGPLVFGVTLQMTGQYRVAVLSLIVFFLMGLAVLSKVDIAKGSHAVGQDK